MPTLIERIEAAALEAAKDAVSEQRKRWLSQKDAMQFSAHAFAVAAALKARDTSHAE